MNIQNHIMVLIITLVISSYPVMAKQATQPVTPTEHISAIINEALAYLSEEGMDRDSKWGKIRRVLHQHFDFRSLAQSVLAKHWQASSPEEQHRITDFFSQYLETIYRTRIEAYTGQRIEYLKEQISGKYAIVDIAITGDSGSIPITFRLRDRNGEWMAYDVIVDGIGLVDSYRTTFNNIIKTEGMDGLMDEIAVKIENYKKRHETDIDAE